MTRFFTFAAAATLTACIGVTAWSQSGQSGAASGGAGASAGAAGAGSQQGTGAGGAAGAGAAQGTAGAAGATGSAGAAGAVGTQGTAGATGSAGAAGQVGGRAGANVGGQQQGQQQIGTAARPDFEFSGINQRPIFTDPAVRQQLRMNRNQFNQLNRAHQQSLNRFNQEAAGLGDGLTPQQRAQHMQQLQSRFDRDFGAAVESTFTDPRQRQRFNQLNSQFQGFGAFNDPRVQQQLNLMPEQRNQLRRLDGEWRQHLRRLRHAEGNNQLTQEQLNQLQAQRMQQINSLLTPEQQQAWAQLVGEPVQFGPDLFLPPQTTRTAVVPDPENGRVNGSRRRIVPHQGAAQGTQNQNAVVPPDDVRDDETPVRRDIVPHRGTSQQGTQNQNRVR